MFVVGCHLSMAKGYRAMGKMADILGLTTFQFFTRNPRGGAAKDLDRADLEEMLVFLKERNFGTLLAHAPYTLNACSASEDMRQFACRMMIEDLERLELFDDVMYNFHPGSHVKQGVEKGIEYIGEMLTTVLDKGGQTPILLETMAGKGSEIGRSFAELRQIIDKVDGHHRMGVCLDTCHVFDAGYDIVHDLEGVLQEFDEIIGLERLKAIHLNDSKNTIGSHKDRHEKLGKGAMGMDTFEKIINHPKLRDLPFYLETPQEELAGYAEEIDRLRALRTEA